MRGTAAEGRQHPRSYTLTRGRLQAETVPVTPIKSSGQPTTNFRTNTQEECENCGNNTQFAAVASSGPTCTPFRHLPVFSFPSLSTTTPSPSCLPLFHCPRYCLPSGQVRVPSPCRRSSWYVPE